MRNTESLDMMPQEQKAVHCWLKKWKEYGDYNNEVSCCQATVLLVEGGMDIQLSQNISVQKEHLILFIVKFLSTQSFLGIIFGVV